MEEKSTENIKEIDLLELALKIWRRKRMVLLWCAVGALVGIVIALSIPKEYETSVKLAPESSDGKGMSSSLGALAAMAGVNVGSSSGDAFSAKLYPEIVQSVPFCMSLFDVKVKDIDEKHTYTAAQYFKEETRSPWWSAVTGLPGKILGAFSSGKKEDAQGGEHKPNSFKLTIEEEGIVNALRGAISTSVDAKTSVVTISVRMQDPMVSAMLADTVVNRLREYITDYRTNKARADLEYIRKLNDEAKEAYYTAQQKYANYLDTHQGMVMYSAQTMRDRLENEATLAFNLFNQTSQQLQMAQAKVQETTPVYATIAPATVPTHAAAPRKMLILMGCIVFAFFLCAAWILFAEPLLAKRKLSADALNNQDSKD